MAAIEVVEFGIMARCAAEESDPAPPVLEQMPRRFGAAAVIVAADRQPRHFGLHRSPAHEMRALLLERVEPAAIELVIAVAEHDDPVGLARIFIVVVPVARELLEADQEVMV